MQRRDVALDGLRGVAVLLVIFLHLQVLGVGWVGVQLFFVLSGFLITRILLAEAEEMPFRQYLTRFYLRRAMRILPALYLYLIVVGVLAYVLGFWSEVSSGLLPASLFYVNVNAVAEAHTAEAARAAFGPPGTPFPFMHLWSLAVEEHFYLLWPLIIFWVGRKHLLLTSLICIAMAPFLRLYAAQVLGAQGWDAEKIYRSIYVLSTSHLDAFASGALVVAIASARRAAVGFRPDLRIWGAVVGFVYLLGVWANASWGFEQRYGMPLWLGYPAGLPAGTQYLWGYTLLNLLFAGFIWLCLCHERIKALMSQRYLCFTGRISYGLYLYHFPLLLGLKPITKTLVALGAPTLMAQAMAALVCMGAAYLVSWLSFRYFETPMLHLGRRWQDRLGGGRAPRQLPATAGEAPVSSTL